MGDIDQTIVDFYRRLDAGKIDSAVELLGPSCKYERAGVHTLNGRAEIAQFYGERNGGAPGRHTVVTLLSGDSVAGVEGVFETGAEPLVGGARLFSDWFRWGPSGICWRRTYHFVRPHWANEV
jgi:hypothetical protein